MANAAQAYDFSLFEPHYDNTVPAPRREEQPQRSPKVIELPKKEPERGKKTKSQPVRAFAAVMVCAAFAAIAVAMVYSQQQLAVLTDQINVASQTLEESKSLEVQLNMQASQKMNGAQVEEYAAKELGMSKVTSSQITYISVAQQDKGTVLQNVSNGSIIDKIFAKFREWFS